MWDPVPLFGRKIRFRNIALPRGNLIIWICPVVWVDIGTKTKVPLEFVTHLSKITKIND
jgi:hypothetical protein